MAEPQTYYRDERDQSDVSGIVVIEQGDGEVLVTENRDDVHWSLPFLMPDQEFRTSTHGDDIERVGRLPDTKFEQVVSIAKSNA